MFPNFAQYRVNRQIEKSAGGVASISASVNFSACCGTFCKANQPSNPPRMVVDSTSATSQSIFPRRYPPPSSSAPSASPSGNLCTQIANRMESFTGSLSSSPPPAPTHPPCMNPQRNHHRRGEFSQPMRRGLVEMAGRARRANVENIFGEMAKSK